MQSYGGADYLEGTIPRFPPKSPPLQVTQHAQKILDSQSRAPVEKKTTTKNTTRRKKTSASQKNKRLEIPPLTVC